MPLEEFPNHNSIIKNILFPEETLKISPFLKHINLNPEEDLHPFARVHGLYKDPYETVHFAEKMGIGTSNYELIEILSPEETSKMEPPKRVFEGKPTFY